MPDINKPNPPEAESERELSVQGGEIEEGRTTSDTEISEDEFERKAIGGYGGDTGEFALRWAPSKENE
ncbi:MAG: hypothetical protein WBV82_05110 [Myxococcaceae bacterium]